MKKYLPTALALFFVILIGLYYDRHAASPAKPVIKNSVIVPTVYLSPTPTPVWKTYTNKKLGFSFSYPIGGNYSLETLDQETAEQLLYLNIHYNPGKKESYINIEVYKGDQTILPPGPTPDYPQKVIVSYQRTTVNNLSFEEYVLNGQCFPRTFQTVSKNRTYIFQDVCGPFPGFDQLIQSIKFF